MAVRHWRRVVQVGFIAVAMAGCASPLDRAVRAAVPRPARPAGPGCTEADLTSPGPAAMPAPTRLTIVETFPTATVTLSPPAPEDAPLVSAQQAWDNALVDKRSDAAYELVLARMSARFPATTGPGAASNPLYQGVLVWVVIARGIPVVMSPSLSSAANAASFVPWCGRLDGLDPTDATSGERLFSDTFGSGT